jgi:hypothetical protein
MDILAALDQNHSGANGAGQLSKSPESATALGFLA